MTRNASVVLSRPSNTRRTTTRFNGVKVFSATMFSDRAVLGERVTEWLAAHPDYTVVEIVQTQSSDEAFHCIALSLFYLDTRA